jgi:hypothetical protein
LYELETVAFVAIEGVRCRIAGSARACVGPRVGRTDFGGRGVIYYHALVGILENIAAAAGAFRISSIFAQKALVTDRTKKV